MLQTQQTSHSSDVRIGFRHVNIVTSDCQVKWITSEWWPIFPPNWDAFWIWSELMKMHEKGQKDNDPKSEPPWLLNFEAQSGFALTAKMFSVVVGRNLTVNGHPFTYNSSWDKGKEKKKKQDPWIFFYEAYLLENKIGSHPNQVLLFWAGFFLSRIEWSSTGEEIQCVISREEQYLVAMLTGPTGPSMWCTWENWAHFHWAQRGRRKPWCL